MSANKAWCKTCAHLRATATRGQDRMPLTVYRCGYSAPAPWPVMTYAPNFVIGSRHVVPGNDYPPDHEGSTSDWTEIMDCPTWAERTTNETAAAQTR